MFVNSVVSCACSAVSWVLRVSIWVVRLATSLLRLVVSTAITPLGPVAFVT